MAKKRMLSQDVVETDGFYNLTPTAQALYLHLNLNADDDGFVGRTMQIISSFDNGKNALQELVSNGYLIEFDNPKAYLIRHWHVNNNKIQGDRYTPTMFQEHYKRLAWEEKPQVYLLIDDIKKLNSRREEKHSNSQHPFFS